MIGLTYVPLDRLAEGIRNLYILAKSQKRLMKMLNPFSYLETQWRLWFQLSKISLFQQSTDLQFFPLSPTS